MKKTITVLFYIVPIISTMYAPTSNASPSLNSQCPHNITTPPQGNGIMFNESCTQAYVFPPKTGTAEIASLARTTNLQFCPAVKGVGQVANRTLNSMNTISQKIETMIEEFEPLNQELIALAIEVATQKAKMESARKRFEGAENHLEELRQLNRSARVDYKDCVDDHNEDHASCIELKNLWDQAKGEMLDFKRNGYTESRFLAEDTQEDYSVLAARYTVLRNRYVEGINPLFELQERLADLGVKVWMLYSMYTKLEGATGQILWTIPWERLLNDYRQANSHLNINWERLPIKEYELISSLNAAETSSAIPTVTGLISAIIPGAKPTGFLGMGQGLKIAGPQTQPSIPTQASATFGNSVGGQVVLTLAGACPYFDGIEERTSVNLNDLTSYIVANLVYSFEVAARREYTATYNLSSMLRRIEEKTKEGGLFSTDVSHSIIDAAESSDWFSISFNGNSAEFQYTPEEQQRITQVVKGELFDKAFEQFAILNAGSALPPKVPDFLESGAAAGARKLRRCWNKYCQASSAVLGVANAIWGESKATADFHQNNSSWATDTVKGIQFVSRTGSLSFRPE